MNSWSRRLILSATLSLALMIPWGAAKAQIKNLNIGIGIDADTLNPQEQTTTLIQNICDLIFDTFFL